MWTAKHSAWRSIGAVPCSQSRRPLRPCVRSFRTVLAPPAVERLLLVIEVKLLARQLFLERIEQRGLEVLLTFHPQTPVEPHRLLQWLQTTAPRFRFHSEHVVRMPLPRTTAEARLLLLKKRLQQLHVGASM